MNKWMTDQDLENLSNVLNGVNFTCVSYMCSDDYVHNDGKIDLRDLRDSWLNTMPGSLEDFVTMQKGSFEFSVEGQEEEFEEYENGIVSIVPIFVDIKPEEEFINPLRIRVDVELDFHEPCIELRCGVAEIIADDLYSEKFDIKDENKLEVYMNRLEKTVDNYKRYEGAKKPPINVKIFDIENEMSAGDKAKMAMFDLLDKFNDVVDKYGENTANVAAAGIVGAFRYAMTDNAESIGKNMKSVVEAQPAQKIFPKISEFLHKFDNPVCNFLTTDIGEWAKEQKAKVIEAYKPVEKFEDRRDFYQMDLSQLNTYGDECDYKEVAKHTMVAAVASELIEKHSDLYLDEHGQVDFQKCWDTADMLCNRIDDETLIKPFKNDIANECGFLEAQREAKRELSQTQSATDRAKATSEAKDVNSKNEDKTKHLTHNDRE